MGWRKASSHRSRAKASVAGRRHRRTLRALDDVRWHPEDTLVIAHRACHATFPENSAEAIAACASEGAVLAEVDLDMTRDGVVVLMRDSSPKRTTTSARANRTRTMLYRDIAALRLVDARRNPTEFRVPTLGMAIRAARDSGTVLWLDTKKSLFRDFLLASRVRDIIRRHRAWPHVVLSSLDLRKGYQRKPPRHYLAANNALADFDAAKPELRKSSANAWAPKHPLRTNASALCRLRDLAGIGPVLNVLKEERAAAAAAHDAASPFYKDLATRACVRFLVTEYPRAACAQLNSSFC